MTPLAVLCDKISECVFSWHQNKTGLINKNLEFQLRDVELPGADAFPNLPSVEARFTSNGFDMATAVSLKSIRTDYTPEGELQRWVTSKPNSICKFLRCFQDRKARACR